MKENTVVCLDCGFKYDGEQKLCPMCGSKRRSPVSGEDRPGPEPRPARKRHPKVMGGVVIIAAMILMTLGFGALMRRMNAPEQEPAPRPEQLSPVEPVVPAEPEPLVLPEPKPQPGTPALNEEQLRRDCQTVVDAYSAKMREAAPRLMEEFKAETEGESDGRVLAYVCNKKIGELAGLCNTGMSEIWDLLYAYGIDPAHPDYDDYTDYEFRLNLVYEDEAMKISELYSEYYILHAS